MIFNNDNIDNNIDDYNNSNIFLLIVLNTRLHLTPPFLNDEQL